MGFVLPRRSVLHLLVPGSSFCRQFSPCPRKMVTNSPGFMYSQFSSSRRKSELLPHPQPPCIRQWRTLTDPKWVVCLPCGPVTVAKEMRYYDWPYLYGGSIPKSRGARCHWQLTVEWDGCFPKRARQRPWRWPRHPRGRLEKRASLTCFSVWDLARSSSNYRWVFV